MSSKKLSLLTFLILPSSLILAISTGSVSIFADSSCKDPVFANNYTLAADICGSPGPVVSFDNAYNSYIVDGRPTCADGTQGSFAMYTDANCKTVYQIEPPGNTIEGTGISLDGVCLGLVEYLSIAFLCNGIPQGSASSSINTLPTVAPLLSATTSTSALAAQTSVTTMTPVAMPPTVAAVTSTASPTIASMSAVVSVGFSAGSPISNATSVTAATLSASVKGTAPLSVANNGVGALEFRAEMCLVALLGLLLQ